MLLLLGWVFVPFYVRSGVYTMPEFLEKRYSPGARTYLTWVSIAAYILTKISVTIAAGAIVFTAIGVSFWTGALIIVVATGVYNHFWRAKSSTLYRHDSNVCADWRIYSGYNFWTECLRRAGVNYALL